MKIKYSLKDIKKISTQKMPMVAALVYNPLSVGLVWIIANFTKITPNQITCLSFLAGLSAAWCFFQGIPLYLTLGAFLIGLAIVLDWTDGKVARLKNKQTALGFFLDNAFGKLQSINIFALSYGQFKVTGQEIFLILGMAVFFVCVMVSSYGDIKEDAKEFYTKIEQKPITEADNYKSLGKLKGFKDYFEKKGIYPFLTLGETDALILIIGPLFGIVKECLIIGLILALLILISYFIIITIDLSRLH